MTIIKGVPLFGGRALHVTVTAQQKLMTLRKNARRKTVCQKENRAVFTIGHSNRTIEEFIAALAAYKIRRLVDVRTIPRSRANPQFNTDSLTASLRTARISYTHMKALGGLRHPAKNSRNSGWRNSSFRGYADFMQTAEFDAGLEKLLRLAARSQVAIMCAEALPWRCHRSLIADALAIRKVEVLHIFSKTSARAHQLTSFAKVRGRRISYPESNP